MQQSMQTSVISVGKTGVKMQAHKITSNNEGLHTCRVSNLIAVLKPDTLPGM